MRKSAAPRRGVAKEKSPTATTQAAKRSVIPVNLKRSPAVTRKPPSAVGDANPLADRPQPKGRRNARSQPTVSPAVSADPAEYPVAISKSHQVEEDGSAVLTVRFHGDKSTTASLYIDEKEYNPEVHPRVSLAVSPEPSSRKDVHVASITIKGAMAADSATYSLVLVGVRKRIFDFVVTAPADLNQLEAAADTRVVWKGRSCTLVATVFSLSDQFTTHWTHDNVPLDLAAADGRWKEKIEQVKESFYEISLLNDDYHPPSDAGVYTCEVQQDGHRVVQEFSLNKPDERFRLVGSPTMSPIRTEGGRFGFLLCVNFDVTSGTKCVTGWWDPKGREILQTNPFFSQWSEFQADGTLKAFLLLKEYHWKLSGNYTFTMHEGKGLRLTQLRVRVPKNGQKNA
ncbi:hypothetical protein M3Y99_01507500 [Aphelenchoides fujianensis]|nr:hypothetical protein M3Y99_01507500 [Aphelenchoides fujianensis]